MGVQLTNSLLPAVAALSIDSGAAFLHGSRMTCSYSRAEAVKNLRLEQLSSGFLMFACLVQLSLGSSVVSHRHQEALWLCDPSHGQTREHCCGTHVLEAKPNQLLPAPTTPSQPLQPCSCGR